MNHHSDLLEDLTGLISTPALLGLPPAKWLMQDLIPEQGFVGLYGAPSSAKSFIALDWAMCVSSGRPWLDHAVAQTPVVYVAAEGGRGIQQRVRAWMEHYGVPSLPNIYWLLEPLYVREEGVVADFVQGLTHADITPGLIVLDTLSRSFGGGEENASADMGHFVDCVTKLAGEYRMASLIIHHKNAQASRERGNTAFRGAADAMFDCTASRGDDGRIIRVELRNDKQKDAIEAEPIYLAPVQGAGSLIFEKTEGPEKKKKGEGVPQPMRKVDMLTLLASHGDGLSFREWMLAAQVPKSTFNRRIKQLTNDLEIYKENGKYFVVPSNTDLAAVGTEGEDE